MSLDTCLLLLENLKKERLSGAAYLRLLDELIDYTAQNASVTYKGERFESFVRKSLLSEFATRAADFPRNPSATGMAALDKLAVWLKPETVIPTAGKRTTVRDIMETLEISPQAKCLHRVMKEKRGSAKQFYEVENCIDLAHSDSSTKAGFGITLGELIDAVLLSVYIDNANHYDGDKTSRKIMHKIAVFLPAETLIPGGEGITVREYDDRVDPTHALKIVTGQLNKGKIPYEYADELACYVQDWPDFSMGSQSMKEIATSCIRAMVISAANSFQSGGDPYGDRLSGTFAAALHCPGSLQPDEAKMISALMKQRSIDFSASSFIPLFYPFGRKARRDGLLKRLFSRRK